MSDAMYAGPAGAGGAAAWLAAADDLAAGYAEGDALAIFGAVDALAHAALGHALCTVNRYDAAGMRVVRVYSSNPAAYPPGGSKEKRGTSWGRHVLLEKRIFIGEGVGAIAQAFDDHAAIAALGLRSVINVPVVWQGICLGTVNFLMTAERVAPAQVGAARLAALHAVAAFGLLAGQSGRP